MNDKSTKEYIDRAIELARNIVKYIEKDCPNSALNETYYLIGYLSALGGQNGIANKRK